MSATNPSLRLAAHASRRQAGTTAVEFALLAALFFTFVFGIIETARMLYVFNTLQEVTRLAAAGAAKVYPTDTAGIARVRQHAVFRNTPGDLILAPPVTDEHIRLDYLRFDLSEIPASSWPADAATNRRICMSDPRAATCIRFVQARVCDTADTSNCSQVMSQMLLPFIDLRVPLHRAVTIAAVESFGYNPGTLPPAACPC